MKVITTGSDFSGVGAFDYAIERVAKQKGFKHKRIYACDWDKYARITYAHNHGIPEYYPHDVYEREIPSEPLDVYMTSPPCQSFSIAGKRGGKTDDRGILFFNSHEFIKVNKPRYFIFENVKGLLSDSDGNTFSEWVNILGGKSVNGNTVMFPYDDSVPYHIYWRVENSKKHGVPQNRERVFIVGIRDDEDNNFRWPKEEHLTRRLKDVLETEVDEKYFLSDKMVELITKNYTNEVNQSINQKICTTIDASYYKGFGVRQGKCRQVVKDKIKVKSATKKGYETATDEDSINFSVPNSETRRGRVGKGLAQTLDTQCNQGVCDGYKIRRLTPRECFRLQDFPDTFDFSIVSNSQAYKQAGNSITVRVLEKILQKLF